LIQIKPGKKIEILLQRSALLRVFPAGTVAGDEAWDLWDL
jgi:hypothetical protein